jgi:PAS domain S-box-containing protein
MDARSSQSSTPAFPVGGGELGALIRAYDWAATPLGPIATWPQSLCAAVNLCLGSAVASFVWWGPDLIQFYNDAALAIVRAKHPADLGRPARAVWADVWPVVGGLLESVLATGEAVRGDDLPMAPDRGGPLETAYFTFSYGPARDEQGHVAGVFCVALETTARVRAEEQLQESEERQAFLLKLSDALRPLADSMTVQGEASRLVGEQLAADRTYYCLIDDERHLLVVERDYVRGDVPSLVGAHPIASFASIIDQMREGRSMAVANVERAPLIAAPDRAGYLSLSIRSFMCVPLIKHGALVAAMCISDVQPRQWTQMEVALLEDVAERAWAAVERTRAEEALRQSEEKYRSLFETMGQGYAEAEVVRDAGGRAIDYRIIEVNPAFERLVGVPAAEALGRTAREVLPLIDDWWIETFDRLVQQGEPMWFEYAISALGRWYEVYAYPRQGDRFTVLYEDITARKQAKAERERLLAEAETARAAAEEAVRAREEFLSIASHELRNPVAVLSGTAQLLRRARASGRLTDDRLGSYLESLERAGAHLAALTNDLLDVSRLQHGGLPLRPEATDVAALLRDIVRRSEWPDHRITLAADEAPLEAVIDVNRIRQVVTNLLENAVKYSPSADEVRMYLSRDDGGFLIEVQDFGIGLPPNTADAIFTPFQRTQYASEAGIPGLGLGLFIARRIAEQHRGRLWAQSDGEGCGAIMSLWLPTQPTEAGERPAEGADHA